MSGLILFKRIGIDEKRCLHRAIVTPKADGTPRCIIKAALIRKTKRHGVGRAPEPPEALADQWPPSQLRKHGGIPLVRRSWWPRGDRREMTILRSVLRPSRSDILRAARFDRHLSAQMNDSIDTFQVHPSHRSPFSTKSASPSFEVFCPSSMCGRTDVA